MHINAKIRGFLVIGFLIISLNFLHSQDKVHHITNTGEEWVDSVMQTLSLDEMIAQLMVVRANNPGKEYFAEIDSYIKDYNIGGVTYFGGHPGRHARQTNRWQAMAKTPLFISIDGEWGPAMRLDSVISFPYQMTLGAVDDDSLIYLMGLEVARQCKALGIHINFAPVVDINSNPANPVIHMRSFGENRENVARKGIMYMKGMQDGGLLVTAKHFPGHGDTDTDSHSTLPLITHTRARLDSMETHPFRQLINSGLDGIMIAHLNIPALEKQPGTPSTLSKSIVTDYLRTELGFNGLIVTDALDMKGVTLNEEAGEIELRALQAGNDILLLSLNPSLAIARIRDAVKSGEVPEDLVREKCRKVLSYKYKASLAHLKPVDLNLLPLALNDPGAELLTRQLFEKSVTILKNDDDIVPLKNLDTLRIASVSIGHGNITPFQERLQYYAATDLFTLPKEPTDSEITYLQALLRPYNVIILSLQNTSVWGGKPYGISQKALKFVSACCATKKVILDVFATPYSLSLPEFSFQAECIILSYQDHPVMQDISAQVIFGGIGASGRLPVTAHKDFPINSGISTSPTRLEYTIPEELDIRREWLSAIDSLVMESIRKGAFPGCQVWAAKDGKVIYNKSFGYHTYQKNIPVTNFDLYDIASLTKVVASTLSIMMLQDEGKINIDRTLQDYLPYLRNTDKGTIILREMLAHQSRLKPWIPFYQFTLKEKQPDPAFYRDSISEEFPVRVAEKLYIKKNYNYVIYDSIISSRLLNNNSYKYSDLGFYFVPEAIENVTNYPFEDYVRKNFYGPLGLSTTGYLPRTRFSLDRIVPTEEDKVFRMQLIHGDVHDPGAAMLGGVSGHAGLFSNANDLGIIAQMLLQEGNYAGIQYIRPETIHEFTQRQFPLNDNRRGVGFDKPLPEYDKEGPACRSASPESYGHTGFTGTYLWVDPANGLTFVFLSNRVHPDAENLKLSTWNIRPKIHQMLYDAIEKSANFGAGK